MVVVPPPSGRAGPLHRLEPGSARRNIPLIAYNTRFPILPWVKVPHLASHILGRMAARISADWEARYAHPIYLLETFVDPKRSRGTCYLAANWKVLGRPPDVAKTIERTGRTVPSSGCWRCLCTAGFGNG
jgi:hypothetical protein